MSACGKYDVSLWKCTMSACGKYDVRCQPAEVYDVSLLVCDVSLQVYDVNRTMSAARQVRLYFSNNSGARNPSYRCAESSRWDLGLLLGNMEPKGGATTTTTKGG